MDLGNPGSYAHQSPGIEQRDVGDKLTHISVPDNFSIVGSSPELGELISPHIRCYLNLYTSAKLLSLDFAVSFLAAFNISFRSSLSRIRSARGTGAGVSVAVFSVI